MFDFLRRKRAAQAREALGVAQVKVIARNRIDLPCQTASLAIGLGGYALPPMPRALAMAAALRPWAFISPLVVT
jgi:hypothetical protein